MADQIFGQSLRPVPLVYTGSTPQADQTFPGAPLKVTISGLPGVSAKPQIAALTNITTADATDLPTAIALANATKAKVNAIIAALKA